MGKGCIFKTNKQKNPNSSIVSKICSNSEGFFRAMAVWKWGRVEMHDNTCPLCVRKVYFVS